MRYTSAILAMSTILLPATLSSSCFTISAQAPVVVPAVAEYDEAGLLMRAPKSFIVDGQLSAKAVEYLNMRGRLAKQADGVAPNLIADIDSTIPAESYVLSIDKDNIEIGALDDSGLFYGIQTLVQMLDNTPDGVLPGLVITDSPRFEYRGLMIDVVRCFLPYDELKRLVDAASLLKINKLHLHLTDDNGWRLEIKKYPKLTDVGAWRVHRREAFPGRANPTADEQPTYGGFYTQEQMRDLVSYAAERHIEVIPEIEMPAHSVAAIAAYPELACSQTDVFVGVLPGIGGKAASIIMCAGKDSTIDFVTDVIDEVLDIFPSKYIHIGGDEAEKSHWKECQLCNRRIADCGIADYEALQGWYMDSIASYVANHGRQVIAWDEVTYGHPNKDIIAMGWQGDGHVAVDYAKDTGRKFVMTPANATYLIRYQGPQWFEPFTYFGNITLADAYNYEPTNADWSEDLCDQLLGVQGSMWTEFCEKPADVQYQIFPRLLAIADVAWRPAGHRDWPTFISATDNILNYFDKQGIVWAPSMYNIQHRAMPNGDGTIALSLECIRPDAIILRSDSHDFSHANATETDITVTEPGDYYFKSICENERSGATLDLRFDFNKATGCTVIADNSSNNLPQVLTNGLRGSLRNSDFEWVAFHNRPAYFIVDLGTEVTIHEIALGVLANANLLVAIPAEITYSVSSDGENFTTVATLITDPDQRYPLDVTQQMLRTPELDATGRYVRIDASNPGMIPEGYPREGANTMLCFDEIIVN